MDYKYYCYIIANPQDRTYNGYTVDLRRRLRQHNGEIKGGAKATHGKGPWRFVAVMACREWTAQRAMQCEWKIKYPTNKRPRPAMFQGAVGRLKSLEHVFPKIPEEIVVFVDEKYTDVVVGAGENVTLKSIDELFGSSSNVTGNSELSDLPTAPSMLC